jgi:hypothetical protein
MPQFQSKIIELNKISQNTGNIYIDIILKFVSNDFMLKFYKNTFYAL